MCMESKLSRRVVLNTLVAGGVAGMAGCLDGDSQSGANGEGQDDADSDAEAESEDESGGEYIVDVEEHELTLVISLENEADIAEVVIDTPSEDAYDRKAIRAGVDEIEADIYRPGISSGIDPEEGEYVFTAYDDEDEELDSYVYEYYPELSVTDVDITWAEETTEYGADVDVLGIEFTLENTSDVSVFIEEFYFEDTDGVASGITTEHPYVTTGSFSPETEDVDGNENILQPGEERAYVAPDFLTNEFGGIPDHPNDCGYEMPGKLIVKYLDTSEEIDLDFNVGGERVNPEGSQFEYCDGTEITSSTP